MLTASCARDVHRSPRPVPTPAAHVSRATLRDGVVCSLHPMFVTAAARRVRDCSRMPCLLVMLYPRWSAARHAAPCAGRACTQRWPRGVSWPGGWRPACSCVLLRCCRAKLGVCLPLLGRRSCARGLVRTSPAEDGTTTFEASVGKPHGSAERRRKTYLPACQSKILILYV